MHKPVNMRLQDIRSFVLEGGGDSGSHEHGGGLATHAVHRSGLARGHAGGHGSHGVHGGHGAHGGGHGGHAPHPEIPHVEGANPLMDDYLRPDSTQAADRLPEFEGKRMLPIYLPTSAKDIQGDGKPVNSVKLLTRAALMDDVLNEDYKNGSVGAIYRAYFMAWVCVGLTILGLSISPYLSAVFAYLAGYYWSEKDLSVGWSIQWWKGKTLTYTQ